MRSPSRYANAKLYKYFQWLTGQTLTVFLDAALTKKYTNPSSDIISVLAGLHDADAIMTDFITTLDTVIRTGRTCTLEDTMLDVRADQMQYLCDVKLFELHSR